MFDNNYWFGKNVFVTGIYGFIGGNLAKTLVSKGSNVFGLLRNRRKEIHYCIMKILRIKLR